jgi:hypothetical protein
MSPLRRIVRGVSGWIVLWLSAPLGGLIAFVALGPMLDVGTAVAGGVIIGLVVGAAQAWALTRPLPRWMIASGLGLAVGSGLSMVIVGAIPGPIGVLLGAAVSGVLLGTAQAVAGPPLRRALWIPLVSLGWMLAWGVSLALAIDARQGFGIFGASGSAVFTALLAITVHLAARRRPTAAVVPAGAVR